MRETQMKEAKQQMKEKAKELAKARSATGKSRLGGAMAVSFFAIPIWHILPVYELNHFRLLVVVAVFLVACLPRLVPPHRAHYQQLIQLKNQNQSVLQRAVV